VEALTVGDPQAPGTDVGPMARADLLEGVHRQVEASVAAGARLLTGGHRLEGPGTFYAPTVLADVRPGVPAYDEEVFGPVAAVIAVDGDEGAVRVANDTRFGLGASVWTADPERGVAVARRIRSGAVFVNAVVASDVRMPFGGTRASGYGRELAAAGIREFVNVAPGGSWTSPAVTAPRPSDPGSLEERHDHPPAPTASA
jgi:succinate-semialdehyde dehydrogenase/glutarate-semialdehyde dehydrogenase